jgi:hypothetical protein
MDRINGAETAFRVVFEPRIHDERGNPLALFRIAAAAGILIVLAPEQSRQAIAAIFSGAEDARRALPDPGQAADAALAYCRQNAEICAKAAHKALEAEKRLKP